VSGQRDARRSERALAAARLGRNFAFGGATFTGHFHRGTNARNVAVAMKSPRQVAVTRGGREQGEGRRHRRARSETENCGGRLKSAPFSASGVFQAQSFPFTLAFRADVSRGSLRTAMMYNRQCILYRLYSVISRFALSGTRITSSKFRSSNDIHSRAARFSAAFISGKHRASVSIADNKNTIKYVGYDRTCFRGMYNVSRYQY